MPSGRQPGELAGWRPLAGDLTQQRLQEQREALSQKEQLVRVCFWHDDEGSGWGARRGCGGTQMHAILNSTESVANLLGIYHGYRGVWYEFEPDGSFRSPTSVNEQQIDKHGAGTPKSIADELMDECVDFESGYLQS